MSRYLLDDPRSFGKNVIIRSYLYSLFLLREVKICCDIAVSSNADPVVVSLFLLLFLGKKVLSQNNESVPSCMRISPGESKLIPALYIMLQEIKLLLCVLVPIGFTQRKIKTPIFL